MIRLQHELQRTLYFSALDPSLLPVHLQKRQAQLLLEQLPFLDRVTSWYSRKDVVIPPDRTRFPCHLQQPEAWDHFTQCPGAQEGVHLAVWKQGDMIAQHAGWGPSHMQLTGNKRATTQLQHGIQLYTQAVQHAPSDQSTYYNLLIHYQSAVRLAVRTTPEPPGGCSSGTYHATPHTTQHRFTERASPDPLVPVLCSDFPQDAHGPGFPSGWTGRAMQRLL